MAFLLRFRMTFEKLWNLSNRVSFKMMLMVQTFIGITKRAVLLTNNLWKNTKSLMTAYKYSIYKSRLISLRTISKLMK